MCTLPPAFIISCFAYKPNIVLNYEDDKIYIYMKFISDYKAVMTLKTIISIIKNITSYISYLMERNVYYIKSKRY